MINYKDIIQETFLAHLLTGEVEVIEHNSNVFSILYKGQKIAFIQINFQFYGITNNEVVHAASYTDINNPPQSKTILCKNQKQLVKQINYVQKNLYKIANALNI